ncbi:uncharacterized protein LOC109719078 [Ananas comosus]|uniref:Uncharacterized protein LOC109719078 n=1 Tax=Ananas comosus TaxID=4615 RepID=A0A6P5FYQ9_ANACO|nr:uncharacterized protein LOC109719078 [Ananas comosus]
MEFHGGGGGVGGGGGGGSRAEAERWLEIAGKLLFARDLVGSKRFAERALESDPLVDGADQILAVADVLLASQSRVGSGRVDWYAVLGLPSGAGAGADPVAVKRHYRRLALLLHPDRNKYPGADAALRLVVDAFAFLSDPSKKALFDAELHLDSSPTPAPSKPSPSKPSPSPAPAPAPASEGSAFWTACPSCCHVHQYNRTYQNRSLRCPNCHRPFHAAEIAVPPPIVPGTNMYYCAWGFFPLGFPTAADLTSGWKPFYPMFPGDQKQDGSARPAYGPAGTPDKGKAVGAGVGSQNSTPSMRNKKTMARKKVGVGPKRRSFGGGSEVPPPPVAEAANINEFRGININEEVKDPDVGSHVRGVDEDMNMMSFHIDVDATEEILGNLHHLPFLREEEVHVRMPKY